MTARILDAVRRWATDRPRPRPRPPGPEGDPPPDDGERFPLSHVRVVDVAPGTILQLVPGTAIAAEGEAA